VYGDDAGKPEQAVSVAKRLTASDEVLIMLGSISSPASLAASQVAQQSETPQIVISGTAQRITTQGNPWVFRSALPDTKFAADLADFINEKLPGKKKVAFIYVNDDFGKGGFGDSRRRDRNTACKSSPKSVTRAAISTSPAS
jgi:branched-chain amino acid transport system substrate-binding protein